MIARMGALYDRIGADYAHLRKPDPRIAGRIELALGQARRVVNVGAGTGSYEPADRELVAVEPSFEMIRQRPVGAAPAIQARAEDLPFLDGEFDAAMAVLTVHHWSGKAQGLREMRRVSAGPVVLLTFDPAHPGTWLGDYFRQLRELDARAMPALGLYREVLGEVEIAPVPIPHDCTDGFLYAYWRRSEDYLDPRIRSGSSSFHLLDNLEGGLAQLADDLASGAWQLRYGDLLELDELDAGYRLVVAT